MKKYENYSSRLAVLKGAAREDLRNEFIVSGVIGKFSLQFELAWKLLKETLLYEGNRNASSGSPREIIKTAFTVYNFMDEALWLEMLKSRNDITHIYDGLAASRMVDRIIDAYIPEFVALQEGLEAWYADTLFAEKQH
jgi:nucleotidyltransferase substrate binding protein (TIGR01987 family)